MQVLKVLSGRLLWKPHREDAGHRIVARVLAAVLAEAGAEREPQKVRLEVEFELVAVNVKLAVVHPNVRNSQPHVHELLVLGQVEAGRQHPL